MKEHPVLGTDIVIGGKGAEEWYSNYVGKKALLYSINGPYFRCFIYDTNEWVSIRRHHVVGITDNASASGLLKGEL